jgi:hypothetical protein
MYGIAVLLIIIKYLLLFRGASWRIGNQLCWSAATRAAAADIHGNYALA